VANTLNLVVGQKYLVTMKPTTTTGGTCNGTQYDIGLYDLKTQTITEVAVYKGMRRGGHYFVYVNIHSDALISSSRLEQRVKEYKPKGGRCDKQV
jgi:hypothetical protein